MDIASAADRRRIAEMLRHPLDRTHDRPFARRLAVEVLKFAQRECGQVRAGPCTEILGGYILAGDVAQIGV